MKANPDLYKKLKDKKTKLGCTLGHCIKTGIDNPGKNSLIVFIQFYIRFKISQISALIQDIP